MCREWSLHWQTVVQCVVFLLLSFHVPQWREYAIVVMLYHLISGAVTLAVLMGISRIVRVDFVQGIQKKAGKK